MSGVQYEAGHMYTFLESTLTDCIDAVPQCRRGVCAVSAAFPDAAGLSSRKCCADLGADFSRLGSNDLSQSQLFETGEFFSDPHIMSYSSRRSEGLSIRWCTSVLRELKCVFEMQSSIYRRFSAQESAAPTRWLHTKKVQRKLMLFQNN